MDAVEGFQLRKGPLQEGSPSKDCTIKEPRGPTRFLSLLQPRQKSTQGLDLSMPRLQLPCIELSRSGVGVSVIYLLPLTYRLWLIPLVTCSMADGVQLGGSWVSFTQSRAHLPQHLVLIHCN